MGDNDVEEKERNRRNEKGRKSDDKEIGVEMMWGVWGESGWGRVCQKKN